MPTTITNFVGTTVTTSADGPFTILSIGAEFGLPERKISLNDDELELLIAALRKASDEAFRQTMAD